MRPDYETCLDFAAGKRSFCFEQEGGQPIFHKEPVWEAAENNFNVGVVT